MQRAINIYVIYELFIVLETINRIDIKSRQVIYNCDIIAISQEMAIAKTPLKQQPKESGIFVRAIKLSAEQFAAHTTIHGLKHVLDSRGNRGSRVFWILIPLICFTLAIVLMVTFLMRYKSNPTRINVETNFGPISEIEFPAVIFCNPNFITDSQIYGLVHSLQSFPDNYNENITDHEIAERLKYIAGFTNNINAFNESELPFVEDVLSLNRFDVPLTMKKVMFPCSKLLYRCRWEGKIVECRDIFKISETFQGYCCGFNVQKPTSDLSKVKIDKPKSTQYFGPDNGLSVILNPLIEKHAMTSVNSEGIKIIITEHNLYPGERAIERMLPHRQETFVEVRPERTDCSNAVRSLPISDRGCVFSNEHQLKFFPYYMEENCRIECRMQMNIKTCSCLPYFYYNTENIETCNFLKIPCIMSLREAIKISQTDNDTNCICPPQCNGQTYELRISSTEIKLNGPPVIDPFQ